MHDLMCNLPPVVREMTELAHLLRHGCSSILVSQRGQVINVGCTELWVEVNTTKRVRINNLVYGRDQIYEFLSSLPDGEYSGGRLLHIFNVKEKQDA